MTTWETMKIFDFGKKKGTEKRAEDRRKGSGDYDGPERRSGRDRRGLKFALRFKIGRPLGPLEDWLAEHYPDEHRLHIEGISDDFHVKDVQVVFATADQRAGFRSVLAIYLSKGEII